MIAKQSPAYVTAAIRLIRSIGTLLILVSGVFFLLRLMGDPARVLLSPDAPPEMVESYAQSLGLRRPVIEQYGLYLLNILHGDFGVSYKALKPALDVVSERLPATVQLGLAGMAIAILVGIPLGALAAIFRSSLADRCIVGFATVGHCLPSFFLGVALMMAFAVQLKIFPSGGGGSLMHLILPAITLGIPNAAILARFTRSAMLDTINQAYIVAARSRGVVGLRLIMSHALPNTGIALLTVTGLLVGSTIIGAIVTETVFAWPGAGSLFMTSVASRDLPVVQAVIVLSATTMVLTNLVVDVLYSILDPRVRMASGR
ncbi:ABC transporter permease subunit [Sinorhizobium medicae]|nr:ABC transporter permease subunit [Sinorhizobium medicae]